MNSVVSLCLALLMSLSANSAPVPGENEGRPACRPTLEARKQIHAVMEQTFGAEKAAEIKGIFDQCARDHPDDPIGHLGCLRSQFTQDEVTKMVDAIKKAHITWQCEEKREMGENEGRPACRPTSEARKQIHAVMQQTFGDEKAADIQSIFDQCARDHPGDAIGHLGCLRSQFTQKEVTEMVDAIKKAHITWQCEETEKKREEEGEGEGGDEVNGEEEEKEKDKEREKEREREKEKEEEDEAEGEGEKDGEGEEGGEGKGEGDWKGEWEKEQAQWEQEQEKLKQEQEQEQEQWDEEQEQEQEEKEKE